MIAEGMAGVFIIVVSLVVFAVFFLAIIYWRKIRLSAEGAVLVIGIKNPSGKWRVGLARCSENDFVWYSFRSSFLRPDYQWPRNDFDIGIPRPLAENDRHPAMSGELLEVTVTHQQQEFTIAISPSDQVSLRTWSESAPPGPRYDYTQ